VVIIDVLPPRRGRNAQNRDRASLSRPLAFQLAAFLWARSSPVNDCSRIQGTYECVASMLGRARWTSHRRLGLHFALRASQPQRKAQRQVLIMTMCSSLDAFSTWHTSDNCFCLLETPPAASLLRANLPAAAVHQTSCLGGTQEKTLHKRLLQTGAVDLSKPHAPFAP
jgi:hypothetical protein